MIDIVKNIDLSPLFVSLKVGFISIIIVFIFGLLSAVAVMYVDKRLRWILDTLFTMPLVLPPTVAGYLLLVFFSLRRPLGAFLNGTMGVRFVQTQLGCIAAATVIAFPLMYRSARATFDQLDVNLIYAGRTLGMSEPQIIFKVILPTCAPGLVSGGILAFARAIGEYGATAMLAGSILGKTRTIATAITTEVSAGNYSTAGFWTIIIVIIAFIVILAINIAGKNLSMGWNR